MNWQDILKSVTTELITAGIIAIISSIGVAFAGMRKKAENGQAEGTESTVSQRKPMLILGLVLLLVIGVAFFKNYQAVSYGKQGKELYLSQYRSLSNDEKAQELFEKAVKAGNADAYYYLGRISNRANAYEKEKEYYELGIQKNSNLCRLGLANLYLYGKGVHVDIAKAAELIKETYNNGCEEANYYMGCLAKKGLAGEEMDGVKALEYFKAASESEEIEVAAAAFLEMGHIYKNGSAGVEVNVENAIEYYRKGIEKYPYYEGKGNYYIGGVHEANDEPIIANDYYKKAFVHLDKCGKEGDIDAMNFLGIMYTYGKGVAVDGLVAKEWYKKAADNGSNAAMTNIGLQYEYGRGNTQKDINKAMEWYEKAAEKGYATAMKRIGNLYYYGKYGVMEGKPDYSAAMQWYKKAVDAGDGEVNVAIGDMYQEGKGKEQDYAMAMEYYKKALDTGGVEAYEKIGVIYFSGKGMEKPDYEQAMNWFKKGAYVGDPQCMFKVGCLYYIGSGMNEPDYEKAKEWLMKAAEQDQENAMFMLGGLYATNKLGEEDYERAVYWYEKAAASGNAKAMVHLGSIYVSDKLGEADYDKAEKNFLKAAELEDEEAMYKLGIFYGYISPKYEEALFWFGKTVDNGGENTEKARDYIRKMVDEGKITTEAAAKWIE